MGMPSVQDHTIVLDLMDSATGQPLQAWRFTGQPRIVIGRASDGDVVVTSPYVSRAHAYLQYENGIWQAVAISAQQLFVNERRVPQIELFDGSVFRLGANGCTLRFSREFQKSIAPDSGQTLSFDPNNIPILQLDRSQLMRDVDEIANGSFFQNLNQNLQRLRHSRKGEAESGQ